MMHKEWTMTQWLDNNNNHISGSPLNVHWTLQLLEVSKPAFTHVLLWRLARVGNAGKQSTIFEKDECCLQGLLPYRLGES